MSVERETLIGVAAFAARVLSETDGQWPPAARAAETRRGLQHIEAECRRVYAAVTSNEERAAMAPPEKTLDQRLQALDRANMIRVYRARLKVELRAGRRSIDSLLRHPPDEILTAKVADLLLVVPKYGRVKVNKLMRRARISPSKTVGGLSERQRHELLDLIRQADAQLQSPHLERRRAYQREYRQPRRIAA